MIKSLVFLNFLNKNVLMFLYYTFKIKEKYKADLKRCNSDCNKREFSKCQLLRVSVYISEIGLKSLQFLCEYFEVFVRRKYCFGHYLPTNIFQMFSCLYLRPTLLLLELAEIMFFKNNIKNLKKIVSKATCHPLVGYHPRS